MYRVGLVVDTPEIRQRSAAGLLVVPGADRAVSALLHNPVIPPRADIPAVLIPAAVHTPAAAVTSRHPQEPTASLTQAHTPRLPLEVTHLLHQAVTLPHPRVLTPHPHPVAIPRPHRKVILLPHQAVIHHHLVAIPEAVPHPPLPLEEIPAVPPLLPLPAIRVVPLPLPHPQEVIPVDQCPQRRWYKG